MQRSLAFLLALCFAALSGCIRPDESAPSQAQLIISRLPVSEIPPDEARSTVRLNESHFQRLPAAVQQGFRDADVNRTAVALLDLHEYEAMYDFIAELVREQGLDRSSYYWFNGGLYDLSQMVP